MMTALFNWVATILLILLVVVGLVITINEVDNNGGMYL